MNYLATKRTEAEGIKEAALADLAGIGDTFARPRLRPFIQEHNPRTVYNVCLNPCYVYEFLNLRNPYHIMVWRSPYLHQTITHPQILEPKIWSTMAYSFKLFWLLKKQNQLPVAFLSITQRKKAHDIAEINVHSCNFVPMIKQGQLHVIEYMFMNSPETSYGTWIALWSLW